MALTEKKIALIGNMNNMFFGMLRYFLDEGFDANLLIFSNEPPHFSPDNDTWYPTKYNDRIKRLPFGLPHKELFVKRSFFRQYFTAYDIFIGCGYSPYYFQRCGLRLHIFIPYGSDIYHYPFQSIRISSPFRLKQTALYLINHYVSSKQREGIKQSRLINNNDLLPTLVAANSKLGISPIDLGVPMVYNETLPVDVESRIGAQLKERLSALGPYNFIVASQARQYWKAVSDSGETDTLKRNDALIRGFASFIQNSEVNDAGLVLFEYGPDVNESKLLIESLGIASYVIWMPKLPRREILFFLKKYVHVGVEQLFTGFFGGTGYEILSQGTPLMVSLHESSEVFETKTNKPFPPIINVNSIDDIATQLVYYYEHPQERTDLGLKSKEWFDLHLGAGLIQKYIDELEKIADCE